MQERRVLTAKALEDDGFISAANLSIGDVITFFATLPVNLDADTIPPSLNSTDTSSLSRFLQGVPVFETCDNLELKDWIENNYVYKRVVDQVTVSNDYITVYPKSGSTTRKFVSFDSIQCNESNITPFLIQDFLFINTNNNGYNWPGKINRQNYASNGGNLGPNLTGTYTEYSSSKTFNFSSLSPFFQLRISVYQTAVYTSLDDISYIVWTPSCLGSIGNNWKSDDTWFRNKCLYIPYLSSSITPCAFIKGMKLLSVDNIPDNWYFKLAEE